MPLESAVVLTTAAPPWYTGTSLNAQYRAMSLARRGCQVVLLYPWLEPQQQSCVFPPGLQFATPDDQAQWIHRTFPTERVRIAFYPAMWSPRWRSIFPVGRLAPHIPPCELLVLEEPEHLTLFRPWARIRHQVNAGKVVGILHTNYGFYLAASTAWGKWRWTQAVLARYLARLSERNCDQVIRLSPAVRGPAGARVEVVNGVQEDYFVRHPGTKPEGLYFIGKLIWEKGWREMLELLGQISGQVLHVFGSGEAATIGDIAALAARQGVTLVMHGASATPWRDLGSYKVFINCSRSEVLCTATAEALAMGKFALVPRHPSNEFFTSHPNCLTYDSPEDFKRLLAQAQAGTPAQVEAAALFSWDAATARLLLAIGCGREDKGSVMDAPLAGDDATPASPGAGRRWGAEQG